MKKIITILLTLFMILFVALACKPNKEESIQVESQPQQSEEAGISLKETNVNLKIGDTFSLVVYGADGEIEYYSGNNDVASIDEQGLITAKGVGTTIVFAIVGDQDVGCTVNVEEKLIGVNSIYLIKYEYALEINETYTLRPFAKNGNTLIDDAKFTYQSLDNSIVTVDTNGKIVALKSGETIVRVGYEDVYVDVSIIVLRRLNYQISQSEVDLSVDGEPVTVSAKVFEGNTQVDDAVFVWGSEDESVATVDKETGEITPISTGTTYVYGEFEYGRATCKVTVYTKVIKTVEDFITIYQSEETLAGMYKLGADIKFDKALQLYNLNLQPIKGEARFTGLLDGGGYEISGEHGERLFSSVYGTIKNLKVTGSYGVWTGALADTLNVGGIVDNVTINATINSITAYSNSIMWYARTAGAMFNFNDGGTIVNSVVNATVAENLSVTDECKNISAFYAVGTGGSISNCYATSNVEIMFVNGNPDAGTVVFPTRGADVLLEIGEKKDFAISGATYSIDNETIATVENGIVTAKAGGSTWLEVVTADSKTLYKINVWTDISNMEGLASMYNNLSGYYRLIADIEMPKALDTYFYEKYGTFPIYSDITATFSGVLDGQNHKIYGANNGGRLFTTVTGTIKNLKIENNTVHGWGAGLCYNTSSTALIENVTIIAKITQTNSMNINTGDWAYRHTNQAGLLISNSGTVKNCTVYVIIPENISINDGYTLADLSAICTDNVGQIVDCEAYCINNYNTTAINFVKNNTGNITGDSTVQTIKIVPNL